MEKAGSCTPLGYFVLLLTDTVVYSASVSYVVGLGPCTMQMAMEKSHKGATNCRKSHNTAIGNELSNRSELQKTMTC